MCNNYISQGDEFAMYMYIKIQHICYTLFCFFLNVCIVSCIMYCIHQKTKQLNSGGIWVRKLIGCISNRHPHTYKASNTIWPPQDTNVVLLGQMAFKGQSGLTCPVATPSVRFTVMTLINSKTLRKFNTYIDCSKIVVHCITFQRQCKK